MTTRVGFLAHIPFIIAQLNEIMHINLAICNTLTKSIIYNSRQPLDLFSHVLPLFLSSVELLLKNQEVEVRTRPFWVVSLILLKYLQISQKLPENQGPYS